MKELFKNLATQTGRFRLRNEVPASKADGLIDSGKEGTGGLKLVTVFIAVLALHVLVIGSISAYHFLKGGPKDVVAANGPDAVGTAPDVTTSADKPTDALADADSKEKDSSAPSIDTNAVAAAPIPNAPTAPVVTTPSTPAPTSVAVQTTPAPVPPTPAPVTKPTIAATAPAPAAVYVVKKGDTLHRIALSHGVTVAQLRSENGLKGNALRVGQKLTLHGGVTAPASTEVASAPAPTTAPVAITGGKNYKVMKGDTLVHIAKSFNTSPAAIMAANKLSDPRKLKIGAVLIIPSKGNPSGTAHLVSPVAQAHGQASLALNR